KWPGLACEATGDPDVDRIPKIILGQKRQGEAIEAMLKPERDNRWALLFAHFGLNDGDWEGVARCLAGAHVPGFQIQRTLEIDRLAGISSSQPKKVRRARELNFFGFRISGEIRGGADNKKWDQNRLSNLLGDYYRHRRPDESDKSVCRRLVE